MVADALSRRVKIDLRAMFARLSLFDDKVLLAELQSKSTSIDQIRGKQLGDESLGLRFHQIKSGSTSNFGLNKDRVCVPNDFDLRQPILREAHHSPYAMHPGDNKMYHDLCKLYLWLGLKRKTDHSLQKLAKLYISEIVRLHGVLALIISDRDPRFTF
ncbi:uncharacterized protein LOC108475220 [Gossypium arboreum]|uniref:uncharacterized protein LOC108475220 n=1 Tax=Gossypium arboreum TaxID=29729 RepID=UPI0008195197|nr:uncharacterized protein LOC108475220 [Gossypium arboreum]